MRDKVQRSEDAQRTPRNEEPVYAARISLDRTQMQVIKGIGPEFAAILWSEGLFRHFENRRQIAAYAGLAPTPWQSGAVDREQGVSKAGNPRLRTTLIQLAWLWLRNQPRSALSVWFHDRAASLSALYSITFQEWSAWRSASRHQRPYAANATPAECYS